MNEPECISWDKDFAPKEDIIKAIEEAFSKPKFANAGVLGADGKMAYAYTKKVGSRDE